MKHIPFFHKWEIIELVDYYDTSYTKEGERGWPTTKVYKQCKCGALKRDLIQGHWEGKIKIKKVL